MIVSNLNYTNNKHARAANICLVGGAFLSYWRTWHWLRINIHMAFLLRTQSIMTPTLTHDLTLPCSDAPFSKDLGSPHLLLYCYFLFLPSAPTPPRHRGLSLPLQISFMDLLSTKLKERTEVSQGPQYSILNTCD